MAVLAGVAGAVDGSNAIRVWSVSTTNDLQAYVHSGTQQGTGRLAGNGDWSGNYTAYGHTPDVMPGETFTFTGSIDGTNGATGSALVESVEIAWDIEAGTIIQHVVNFASNGALTLGAAAATDVVVPDPPTSIGCKLTLAAPAATPAFSEVTDIRTMTLTITSSNPSYASSTTAAATKRLRGNIDFTFTFSVYEDDFADIPAAGDIQSARVYVDATTFWDLNWIMFGEASGLEVDIEGPGIVGATLNSSMNGFTGIAATPTVGFIKTPAAVTYWPIP